MRISTTGTTSLFVVFVSALFAVSAGGARGQIEFASPVEIGPSGVAWDSLLVDLNADGHLDLVALRSHSISRRLGDGNGGFHSHRTFQAARDAIGVTAADFDGDGTIDLAVVGCYDTNVSVLFGDGSGDFADPVFHPLTQQGGHSVEAGDFNGDGFVDLVATTDRVNGGGYEINLFLGDGAGSFTGPFVTDLRAAGGGGRISIADIDGDGADDLVRYAGANRGFGRYGIEIRYGATTQPFAELTIVSTEVAPLSVRPAYLDDDANVDLVFVTFDGTRIGFLGGRGDGTFDPPRYSLARAELIRDVADFDADGILDLLVTVPSRNSGLAVYRGDGNGRFRGDAKRRGIHAPVLKIPVTFLEVAAGDLDSDGRADIVFSTLTQDPAFFSALNLSHP